ncbi:flagellar basal body rod protein FlgB [Sulfitobacter sp. S0837]|uniref:flagellar basal body rod protein FlgB n=1 Tax=Sulfitobacter maritimus TaxID=2741719 RepID=UPI0015827E73|nr:flagellar basal body rod protein FlgB [Sulfitobacter maritimus]NUH64979.1 flagellar basal body rod protein FlgB [Sulfitobacter maritimus]
MNLSNLSILGLASDRMQWLSARQKVTSENIANAATPNYKARDVSSFETMLNGELSRGTGLVTTHDKHLTGVANVTPGVRTMDDRTAANATLDGNTVNLEEQSVRASEISDQYRLAAQLYRKSYDMLTMAVTGNR